MRDAEVAADSSLRAPRQPPSLTHLSALERPPAFRTIVMSPLARILRFFAFLGAASAPVSKPDPQRDRALIERALKSRLSAHLRKDVGGGD